MAPTLVGVGGGGDEAARRQRAQACCSRDQISAIEFHDVQAPRSVLMCATAWIPDIATSQTENFQWTIRR
ncbi:hypothetical protein SAMN06296028_1051 [Kocuria indica]|uniref:Uncharacterized protein n=1 Tax=Kocuria marina subsp. indica TaxID=1049583 RepID=A0A1X7CPP3_9MICC|nr:hypothetical protein SAMN06296028_1051 [Kocuria indica]